MRDHEAQGCPPQGHSIFAILNHRFYNAASREHHTRPPWNMAEQVKTPPPLPLQTQLALTQPLKPRPRLASNRPSMDSPKPLHVISSTQDHSKS